MLSISVRIDADGWMGEKSCFMTIDVRAAISQKMVLGERSIYRIDRGVGPPDDFGIRLQDH